MKKLFTAVVLFVLVLCAAGSALAADKFQFEQTQVTIFEGDTLQIPLVRDGKYAQGGQITYTSNNTRAVSVSADGTITGLSRGDATVSCTLKADKGVTKRCTVQVKVARKVTAVSLNTRNLNLYTPDDNQVLELMETETEYPVLVIPVGKQIQLSATASPDDASNRKVLFETSDPAVAVIQSSTVLKGTKAGECDLKVYSKQNPEVTDMYHLVVVQPVTKLTLNAESKNVNVGSTLQLYVDYQPATATMKQVNWTAESKNVTVDENGLVTGLKRGSANVKATAADGSGRSATISLNVQQGPESITLRNSSEVVNVGASKRFTATVLPSNTNNQNVTWSSSDPGVATVTKNGTVKGIAVGTCQLTCTCDADESVYATLDLQVQQPVTKVVFTETNVSLDVNTSINVNWNVFPANATNPRVTLKSANERIALVDQNGRVTGVKKGSCKIVATSTDGSNKTGSITVRVTQPVEGVYFRQDIYHVPYREYMTVHAYTQPKDADNQAMTWYTENPYVTTVSAGHTKSNYVSLYGQHVGTTTLYTTTDDGGFTASATAVVDHYYDPVSVTDLYVNNNAIKLRFLNQTNMTLTRVYFRIEVYDTEGYPLKCNSKDGSNVFTGYYMDPLYPGDYTTHGRFCFENFAQPVDKIGGLILRVTGYKTNETYTLDGDVKDYSLNINADKQVEVRYPSNFKPTPIPTNAPPEMENAG